MGMTMTQKILAKHAGLASVSAGQLIEAELDLKKAAKSVGEKSLAMIHVKEITSVTGYVRGGCTAVGMKKQYVTRIDASAKQLETMIVSGGRIGSQIELRPEDLCRAARAEFAEITQ